MKTDAVARGCIADISGCNLIYKCDECKKEIAKLVEIDDMFGDYFKRLEYLLKKAEEKKEEK